MPSPLFNIRKAFNGFTITTDGDIFINSKKEWISWTFPVAGSIRLTVTDPDAESPVNYETTIDQFSIVNDFYPNDSSLNTALDQFINGTIIVPSSGGTIPALLNIATKNNILSYHFSPGDMSFLNKNPELFLMRQSKHSGVRRHGHINKGQQWVHPSDQTCETKWAGWKFFRGNFATGRTTEFSISSSLAPYQRVDLTMNKCMFRQSPSGVDNVPDSTYTVNDFLTRVVKLTGSNKRKGGWAPSMVAAFKLRLAIDDTTATLSNGKCPKIFLADSDIFYTFPAFKGAGSDGSGFANIALSKDLRKSKMRFVHA